MGVYSPKPRIGGELRASAYRWVGICALILSAVFPGSLAWGLDLEQVNCIRVNAIAEIAPMLEWDRETELLAQFDPEKIDPSAIRRLSSNGGTFRVKLITGEKYVLRIASDELPKHEPAFERFASDFVQHAGGLITPRTRELRESEARGFLQIFAKKNRKAAADFFLHSGGRPSASVTVFLDSFIRGTAYLRETLGLGEGDPKLSLREVERLPFRVRQDLFDLWAMAEILGVYDFHSSNWMVLKNRVAMVDIGFPSRVFQEGDPTPGLTADPFGLPSSQQTAQTLRNGISSPMRQFLRGLTAENVREVAEESGFPITDREVQGVLARARSIADGSRSWRD